jgi:hypothetical protein
MSQFRHDWNRTPQTALQLETQRFASSQSEPDRQVPQFKVPPQPSSCVPHCAPRSHARLGTHVGGGGGGLHAAMQFLCPFAQSVGEGQSGPLPHFLHNFNRTSQIGSQPDTQRFVSSSQSEPDRQVPQFKVPPQPSSCIPHCAPRSHELFGLHGGGGGLHAAMQFLCPFSQSVGEGQSGRGPHLLHILQSHLANQFTARHAAV